jgi:RNase H-fold protein (predicted Holliday junction resolvase)
VPVEFHDERLSSFEADESLKGSGLTHKGKKKVQDAIAAANILQDWMRR